MTYQRDLGVHAGYTDGRIEAKRLADVCSLASLTRFVETGTYLGGGVDWALGQHFAQILSCEYSGRLYDKAVARFAGQDRVQLRCDDSAHWLSTLNLSVPSLYYLDAHDSGGETQFVPGRPIPLIEEMRALTGGDITRSVIAIDDERLLPQDMISTVLDMARGAGMADVYVDDTIVLVGARHRWDA
jgi:hypothetical protein